MIHSGLFCEDCGEEIPMGCKAYIMNDDTVMCEACFDIERDEVEDDLYCVKVLKEKEKKNDSRKHEGEGYVGGC